MLDLVEEAESLVRLYDLEDLALYERGLVEGKSLATLKKRSIDRQVGAGLAQAVDPKRSRWRRQKRSLRNRKALRGLVSGLERDLVGVYRKYQKESIDRKKMAGEMKRLLWQAYRKAFSLGIVSSESSLPVGMQSELQDNEEQWLESFRRQEGTYFNRLIQDIVDQKSKQKPEYRLGRYARTVNSVFEAGRVMSTPHSSIIEWKTHSEFPCPGCVLLARHSPYIVSTLPTTPKAGATPCLDHCKCTLEIRSAAPSEALAVGEKNLSNKTLYKKLLRIKNHRSSYRKPSKRSTYRTPSARPRSRYKKPALKR